MLINNTRRDIKYRLDDLEITQADLAREMGWATQTLSTTLNRGCPLTKSFIDIMETLGLDIEFRYIPRANFDGIEHIRFNPHPEYYEKQKEQRAKANEETISVSDFIEKKKDSMSPEMLKALQEMMAEL